MTGLFLGILTAFIMCQLFDRAAGKRKYLLIIPLIPFIVWSFYLTNSEFWKAMGSLSGIIMGYFIESEVIKFRMPRTFVFGILRLIAGLSVVVALKVGLKLVLPESLISDAFRYCCIGLWIAAGAPALFTKIRI